MKVFKLEWLKDLGSQNGTVWVVQGFYTYKMSANKIAKQIKRTYKNCIDTKITDVYVHDI